MNPDLPCHVLRGILLSMEALGHDAPACARNLRPGGMTARSRSSWEELVGVLESFFTQHGGDATRSLMQHLASRHSSVRTVAELLGSPRLSYLVLLEALVGRQAVVMVSCRAASQGLAVRLELHRGLRASVVFFQCCAWFLAAMPGVRGLAEARVLTERLSERELDCVVFPPHSPELTLSHPEANVKALARELFRFHDGAAQASPSTPSAQVLQGRFGLTRAEARVVRRLAEGHSIRRIAEDLEVSLETARTHAKRAMQKTDTHRQAELVSLVLQGER